MLRKFMFTLALVLLTSFSFAQSAPDVISLDANTLDTAMNMVVAETVKQLGSGATVGTVFSSPAFLTVLFGLLGSLVTFFSVNGLKLSTEWIKGRKTQLLAVLISAISAGGAGYFGLSEVAGVSCVEGALLAALSTLGSFGIAVGAHETRRQAQTGARKPERKAGATVSDTILDGLILASKVLPPPFSLAAPVIRNLYEKWGAEYVSDLIDQQRALSEAELKDAGDVWEKEQETKAPTPVVTTAAAK